MSKNMVGFGGWKIVQKIMVREPALAFQPKNAPFDVFIGHF